MFNVVEALEKCIPTIKWDVLEAKGGFTLKGTKGKRSSSYFIVDGCDDGTLWSIGIQIAHNLKQALDISVL